MPASQTRVRHRDLRTAAAGPLGRPEFLSLNQPMRPPGVPPPRRASMHGHACSKGGGASLDDREVPADGDTAPLRVPEQDCMQLHPTVRGIAYSSLLAIDISLSKRMGVCVSPQASWGSVRYLVSMLALSGHGVTWVCGTLICLSYSNTTAGQEVLLNLLMALVLDIMTVAGIQKLTKRHGPWDLPPGFLDYVAMDRYSFPAAHASRAAMVTKFLLNHLVLAVPLRILLRLWVVLVGVSRVMLGMHHLSDVCCGFALGLLHYALVETVWLSGATCESLLALAALCWSPSSYGQGEALPI